MKQCSVRVFALASAAALAAGCAVLPTPDPRDPGAVKDSPVVLRVCSVDGDGAHLAVGDQVELATNQLGRLRIRHLPSALWRRSVGYIERAACNRINLGRALDCRSKFQHLAGATGSASSRPSRVLRTFASSLSAVRSLHVRTDQALAAQAVDARGIPACVGACAA
jgi:hypothetical protein